MDAFELAVESPMAQQPSLQEASKRQNASDAVEGTPAEGLSLDGDGARKAELDTADVTGTPPSDRG